MIEHIIIDDLSSTPKYLQIFNSIYSAYQDGLIVEGQKLPSLSEVCAEFNLAKRTVEHAFDRLKEQQIIASVKGKGYYIKPSPLSSRVPRILLLFNKLSPHKELIYNAFTQELGPNAVLDFYVYNNNFNRFKAILTQHQQGYTHYVIIAHFFEGGKAVTSLLNELAKPDANYILLDNLVKGINFPHSSIYQPFKKDLYGALQEALPLLQKYHTLNIILPELTYHPNEILEAFQLFCSDYQFNQERLHSANEVSLQAGHAYINVMDEELVPLLKEIKRSPFVLGESIGLLSYNETPMKEVLLEGITVLSTDFSAMGITAARLVLQSNLPNYEEQHICNPFRLIVRKSL